MPMARSRPWGFNPPLRALRLLRFSYGGLPVLQDVLVENLLAYFLAARAALAGNMPVCQRHLKEPTLWVEMLLKVLLWCDRPEKV